MLIPFVPLAPPLALAAATAVVLIVVAVWEWTSLRQRVAPGH